MWLRAGLRLMRLVAIAFVVLAVALYFAQWRLLYYPRHYPPGLPARLAAGGFVLVPFDTSRGTQWAYYVPPAGAPAGTVPDSVWVLFGGNGSAALDWLGVFPRDPTRRAGLLLVEYPGYGECEGSPSRAGIRESLTRVVPALAAVLSVEPAQIESRLSTGGHSLGAAVALEFAMHYPVREIVLLAPFTSMKDMARRSVGWPLCEVLRDRYDNRTALAALSSRVPRPTLRIFHGARDSLIPASMSRELAGLNPGWAVHREFPEAEHERVVEHAAAEWNALLR
ncbi:hypothetical protein AYO41_01090 [Verrucomicrobia bacterium SCGC AG-212-E04]|nr:hypothetical protein AYO41_01090 [Verrucomicrobia bacterium SCGC AG-212-E04]